MVVMAVAVCTTSAAARPARAQQQPEWRILDNSFLVEEAFNQERGVFQNIFTWARTGSGEWIGTFTQEWPVPGIRHQLSYTIPFSRQDQIDAFNDVLINYRYQVMEGESGSLAIAPRLSLSLPTGDAAEGFGAGKAGLQWNVPASKQFGNLYVHANVGMAWVPDVQKTTILAASGIWQTRPMFHLMLEAVGAIDQTFTLSPGFRGGWGDEHQVVVGLALPITWTSGVGGASKALLTYFSYELPFRKLH